MSCHWSMGMGGHTPLRFTHGPRLSQTNMAVCASVAVSCEGRLHRCKVCKCKVAQQLRVHKHHSKMNGFMCGTVIRASDACPTNESMRNITMGRLPTRPTIIDTWSVCTTALAHPCAAVAHLLNGGVRWHHRIERTRCCWRCIGVCHSANDVPGAPIAGRNCCHRLQQ